MEEVGLVFEGLQRQMKKLAYTELLLEALKPVLEPIRPLLLFVPAIQLEAETSPLVLLEPKEPLDSSQ